MNTTYAADLIRKSHGKIFTCTFVKKNGEVRKMNGRLGVAKDLTGKGLAFDPESKGLMTCYDMQKKAYRMIGLDSLLEFKCGKISWKR